MTNESGESGGSFPLKPPVSPEQYASEVHKEATVTMVFPRSVILTDSNHQRIQFEAGPQEVPASLKDHWYLAANGVTEYKKAAPPEEPAGAKTAEELAAMTKDQLVAHAAEAHGLELSAAQKKDELIGAIQSIQKG